LKSRATSLPLQCFEIKEGCGYWGWMEFFFDGGSDRSGGGGGVLRICSYGGVVGTGGYG
jgi:hypothetical protein